MLFGTLIGLILLILGDKGGGKTVKSVNQTENLQVEDALRPHVQQEVEDAEVGQETVLLSEHLVIGLCAEVGIW